MTLHRAALAELAREAIAARHVGYRVAIEKLAELRRAITPEMILKLVEDAQAEQVREVDR